MEEKKIRWVNYGDVNPLEHGGIFVASDEEINGKAFEGYFYVERVQKLPMSDSYVVDSAYIGLDNAKELAEVEMALGSLEGFSDEKKAVALLEHFGGANFGTVDIYHSTKEVLEYFRVIGIELEGGI
ncbi:hypothetical protein D3C81_08130 [compost metagenome]